MSLENKEHYQSEKEAIHLLLTVIGDEIYSTIDACKTAHDMWIAIERLQQGESLNIQDVKTNLFWKFGIFTSHDGEIMESYYSRFYKMMNETIRNNLKIATMQVNVQFLQQLQPEWSRFVTIVKQNHNLDTISYHKLFDVLKQSHASTKYKGKEIAKPITPPSESASEEDSDPEQAHGDKDMQKNLALIAKYFKKIYKPTNNNLRTSSNSRNNNMDTSPRKPKRVKDYTYHKEKMLLCKQAKKGVPLQAEQANWLEDIDEEIDEQELEAHYSYMTKIEEVPIADSSPDTEPLELVDSNVAPDLLDMCDNDIQTDQNAEQYDDERAALAALANLIANLTLDIEENKNILKQLKKANASLTQELKECKSNLEESNTTRDSCLIALQSKQTELETYKTLNNRTVDYDNLERKLNETLVLFTQKEIDIKEGLKLKAYEISVVKEKHDELVKQSFLTKSHYEGLVKEKTKIPYDTSDLANRFVPDREETSTLEKESRSKLNKDLVKPYDYTKQNSLYENFKPTSQEYHDQLAHANEVRKKM
ncbi:hypothetical protein Tco_1054930 [Tanacetum coccineum]|uniref:Gag-Pol polyprotein n=1 Tax=Tanacetum coccineum TaxID=301880 RepID=A0ABQ5H0J4_9ASTR